MAEKKRYDCGHGGFSVFFAGDTVRHRPVGLEEELKGDLKGLASLGMARFPLNLLFCLRCCLSSSWSLLTIRERRGM